MKERQGFRKTLVVSYARSKPLLNTRSHVEIEIADRFPYLIQQFSFPLHKRRKKTLTNVCYMQFNAF